MYSEPAKLSSFPIYEENIPNILTAELLKSVELIHATLLAKHSSRVSTLCHSLHFITKYVLILGLHFIQIHASQIFCAFYHLLIHVSQILCTTMSLTNSDSCDMVEKNKTTCSLHFCLSAHLYLYSRYLHFKEL